MNPTRILLVASLLGPIRLPADVRLPLVGLQCEKQAVEALARFSHSFKWKRERSEQDAVLYKSATDVIAHWVEARATKNKEVSFRLRTPESLEYLSFDSKTCRLKREVKPIKYSSSKMDQRFTDHDLQALISQQRAGLVYAWSPHMPLSLAGLKEIRATAKKLDLPLEVVLDPHANRQLASQTVQKLKLDPSVLRRMESWELYYRDLVQHYPAAILYENGKIASPVYAGYKPRDTYLRFFTKHLSRP